MATQTPTGTLTTQTSTLVTGLARPPGPKTFVAGGAMLVVVIASMLKKAGVDVPAVNMDTAQEWTGFILGTGIITLRVGMNTVGKYVVSNIVPLVVAALRDVVQRELAAKFDGQGSAYAPVDPTAKPLDVQFTPDDSTLDMLRKVATSAAAEQLGVVVPENPTPNDLLSVGMQVALQAPALIARLEASYAELQRAASEAPAAPAGAEPVVESESPAT